MLVHVGGMCYMHEVLRNLYWQVSLMWTYCFNSIQVVNIRLKYSNTEMHPVLVHSPNLS